MRNNGGAIRLNLGVMPLMHSASGLSRCKISFGASAGSWTSRLVGCCFVFYFFKILPLKNKKIKKYLKTKAGVCFRAQWSSEPRPLACFTEADKGGVDVLKSVQWIRKLWYWSDSQVNSRPASRPLLALDSCVTEAHCVDQWWAKSLTGEWQRVLKCGWGVRSRSRWSECLGDPPPGRRNMKRTWSNVHWSQNLKH